MLLAKCLNCFEQAAKQGVSSAMFYLGMIHLEGRFVPGDA
jgi:TPR repeat protein